MPKIPFFKEWFNGKFSDLCAEHDAEYAAGTCKLCSDYYLAAGIAGRGYGMLSILTFLAVQLPWVWGWYLWNKYNGK